MQMDWIAIMSRFNIILYKTSDIHTHFYSVHTQKWVHEGKLGFWIFPKDTLTCEIAPGTFEDFFNCNKILVSTMYK